MKELSIEIGHTYAPHRLAQLSNQGVEGAVYDSNTRQWFKDTPAARVQKEYADNLSIGKDVIRLALVDDVAAQEAMGKSNGDSWRHALFMGISQTSVKIGTEADVIHNESDYKKPAIDIISAIFEHNDALPDDYRISDDERSLIQGSGKQRVRTPLYGFNGVEDPNHPSCPVLDLAWLRYKLTLAPEAITVLDDTPQNRRQQQQVASLSGLFKDMDTSKIKTEFLNLS